MDGLVFVNMARVSWRQWLHLLVHHTPDYRPQPYQQLAKVERAAGHDNNARHILITQQDELRRRDPDAFGGRLGYLRHWLWGWLGRYGYRAHRLVIALPLAGGSGSLSRSGCFRRWSGRLPLLLLPPTPGLFANLSD